MKIVKKNTNTQKMIDALKYQLNQIIPVYINAKLSMLRNAYAPASQKDAANYFAAKHKYAMILQLIQILDTLPPPQASMHYALS